MIQPSQTQARYVVTATHLGSGERYYLGTQTDLSLRTMLTLQREPTGVSQHIAEWIAAKATKDETLVDVVLERVDHEGQPITRPACAECGSDRDDIRNPGIIAEFGPDAICCEVPVG